MLGPLVYTLCALTATACALLLLRAYRRHRSRLLLWSALCFVGLSLSNVLVVVDLVVFPNVSLFPIRNGLALIGMLLLLYGLIWESE